MFINDYPKITALIIAGIMLFVYNNVKNRPFFSILMGYPETILLDLENDVKIGIKRIDKNILIVSVINQGATKPMTYCNLSDNPYELNENGMIMYSSKSEEIDKIMSFKTVTEFNHFIDHLALSRRGIVHVGTIINKGTKEKPDLFWAESYGGAALTKKQIKYLIDIYQPYYFETCTFEYKGN
jgi:hypothetical protein